MGRKGSYKVRFTKEEIGKRLNEGKTRQQIAKDLGLKVSTLAYHMGKLGFPKLENNEWARKYKHFDPDGFKTLDNPAYAYWAGFIAADGCISISQNKASVGIRLKDSDYKHLERYKKDLGLEQPVTFGFATTVNSKHRLCQIHVAGWEFPRVLEKWGIFRNKSLSIQWPSNLPEKAMPHFIRGYFDGNGTIYERNRVGPKTGARWHEVVCRFISGSPDFLKGLENELNRRGIITNKTYKNGDTNAHVLPLSGKIDNLLRFSDFIYTPGAVCLERKKVYFDALEEKAA